MFQNVTKYFKVCLFMSRFLCTYLSFTVCFCLPSDQLFSMIFLSFIHSWLIHFAFPFSIVRRIFVRRFLCLRSSMASNVMLCLAINIFVLLLLSLIPCHLALHYILFSIISIIFLSSLILVCLP